MSKTIEYIILIILFIVTAISIFQLRSKVADLETISKATSASSIATIQASATTALSTANTANTAASAATSTANTALTNANAAKTTANSIAGTANTALTNANTALGTANSVNSSQTSFSSGFSVVRVLPTFTLGPSLSSVTSIDPNGGYLRFTPTPCGKMSYQLMITAQSGHENDPNIYFDVTTPYKCTLLNDWNFYASSTFDDADLDEVLQSKISQISPTTLRCKFVGNGRIVNYARLTFQGNWST